MRIKFTESYADQDAGYKALHEYDFIDSEKAMYFISHGLALPIENAGDPAEGRKTLKSASQKKVAEEVSK